MKTKATRIAHKVHWLVLLRHSMEDLPVAIFEGPDAKRKAKMFADYCDPMGTKEAREVLSTDCSTPICVWVIKFVSGRPVSSEMVREIEDE